MFNPPKNILIRFLILIVISLYVLFIYMDIYNKIYLHPPIKLNL